MRVVPFAIPSVPLPLLPSLLQSVREVVLAVPAGQAGRRREELGRAVYGEILRVGEGEKEWAMGWWGVWAGELVGGRLGILLQRSI